MQKPIKSESIQICPNCDARNSPEAIYCHHCGQKQRLRILSVWSIIYDFFDSLFNYDSKLFASIRGLFVPGFLTRQYLASKRVSYLSPVKTFVFLMLVFFAILFKYADSLHIFASVNDSEDKQISGELTEGVYNLVEQGFVELRYEKLLSLFRQEVSKQHKLLDWQQSVIEKKTIDPEKLSRLVGKKQTKEDIQTQIIALNNVSALLDQLENRLDIDMEKTMDITLFTGKNYQFKVFDINTMSAEELTEKYGINNWMEKIVVTQVLKFNKNITAFRDFIVNNIPWTILIEVMIISMLSKLFYLRQKRKYVEHFIFHLNLRSSVFVIGSLVTVIPFHFSSWIWGAVVLYLWIFSYWSMLKVYEQGWFITLVKNLLLALVDLIVLLFSMLLVILVITLIF